MSRHAGLREQLSRARVKQVTVRQAERDQMEHGELRAPIAALIARWRATRELPTMSFLVQWSLGATEDDSRFFIAEREGAIIAVARVVPVPQRVGWFIEHLIRAPDAPNGTVEMLVDAVMRDAQEHGRAWVTLGLAPLAGDVPATLRVARRLTPWLYDFEGLRRFKSRLRPDAWDPIFVARPHAQSVTLTMLDVLAAFTPRGLVRFAAQALARGPAIVVALLAALLVPWTVILATSSAERWFAGHGTVKWAWVVFDALVVAGLGQLVRKPSVASATVLLSMVAFDALASPVEVLFWNVDRMRSLGNAAIIVVACLAPALATFVLYGARKRLAAQLAAEEIAASHDPDYAARQAAVDEGDSSDPLLRR